jgi:crotonobetainyl-CoA:carnitine CoA-transferase CaiB-like acyl-CoA transferase
VLDDPQVRHLGLTETVEHARAGVWKFVGGPVRYEDLTQEKSTPPPLVGEQSCKILRELGYDEQNIDQLIAQGVTHAAFRVQS